jgi:hypothetical protein
MKFALGGSDCPILLYHYHLAFNSSQGFDSYAVHLNCMLLVESLDGKLTCVVT